MTKLYFQKKNGKEKTGENVGGFHQKPFIKHICMTLGLQKGARITRDVIKEAVSARSLPDNLLVAWDKVQSGAGLSPAQRKAFVDLALERRNIAWQTAKRNAEVTGVQLPRPDPS